MCYQLPSSSSFPIFCDFELKKNTYFIPRYPFRQTKTMYIFLYVVNTIPDYNLHSQNLVMQLVTECL